MYIHNVGGSTGNGVKTDESVYTYVPFELHPVNTTVYRIVSYSKCCCILCFCLFVVTDILIARKGSGVRALRDVRHAYS